MRKNCLFLLLCCILLVCFPSCRKEPQTVDVKFKDAYLPVTQLSVSDFTIGMTIEEVELLLEPLEVNQEYVYWHGHYFFRAVNGESVLLEITADEAGRYHVTNVQTTLVSQLATRQDYMSLEKGMSVAEKIYERHNTIAGFLMMIGVDEETAYEDSCKIEHCISDKTFGKLKAFIEKRSI